MHSVNVVIFSPAQLYCVRHSQNMEPTIYGTSELALSVFKRQLKTHLFQYYRLVLAAAVGVVYRRPAPLRLYSEFSADYKCPDSTQLNSLLVVSSISTDTRRDVTKLGLGSLKPLSTLPVTSQRPQTRTGIGHFALLFWTSCCCN